MAAERARREKRLHLSARRIDGRNAAAEYGKNGFHHRRDTTVEVRHGVSVDAAVLRR
jgi:hypothetical protein